MSYKRKTKITLADIGKKINGKVITSIPSYTKEEFSKDDFLSERTMTQKEYLLRFKQVTEAMYQTTGSKNHDYATPTDAFRNFRDFGLLGVLVRMSDKFARLKTALAEGREFKVNESVIDTVTDLAVYSVILRIMIESGEFKK